MNGLNGTSSFDAAGSSHPLMKMPAIREFDAFPKVAPTYKTHSSKGGFLTVFLTAIIALLVWYELKEYLFGEPAYAFAVDKGIAHQLQINVDLTVAMPCHYLTVDVRDAVGDRLHISDEFKLDGTSFEIGQAHVIESLKNTDEQWASKFLREARSKKSFAKTRHPVKDGPACRIYGSMEAKKVTGNLHITTLGHGYLSWEHTDHNLMNLSHVIHEFSFGPFFPRISQPLDNSVEIATTPFHIFQYFVSVVSTQYIDAGRRVLDTNQYSVTDMSRETQHGRGVPGIFFKYDIEPMSLTISERTVGLIDFLVRLSGIIGGILVVTSYAWRVGNAAAKYGQRQLTGQGRGFSKAQGDNKGLMPLQSPEKGKAVNYI